MRIERLINTPKLWSFISENLPETLEPVFIQGGYGGIYGVQIKEPYMKSKKWYQIDRRPTIAYIEGLTIVINMPQYFSDFEDLVRIYEEKFKKEITVKIWETI